MGTIYLRQDLERAILRHTDENVGEVVNVAIREQLEDRGWLEQGDE